MKYIILVLITFILSGCSVDYQLTINEQNEFQETIIVRSESKEESNQFQEKSWPVKLYYYDPDLGENPEKIEGVTYYAEELFLEHNYYHRKLTNTFSKENFVNANSIQSCYEHFYVTEDKKEKTITISTSSEFLCMEKFPEISQINIQIEIDRPVIVHNAAVVHDHIYEWNITSNNIQESGIILTFPSTYKTPKVPEEMGSKLYFALGIMILFFLFIFCVIGYKIKTGKE